ncbi:MAG: hypothetical protein ACRCST_09530 [Turicibacter sp.]
MNEIIAIEKKHVVMGVGLIILGGILFTLGQMLDNFMISLVGAGLIGFSIVFTGRVCYALKNKRFKKELEQGATDERHTQIYQEAGHYSFWITLAVIVIMGMFKVKGEQLYFLLPMMMLATWTGIGFFLLRKR